MYHTGMDPFTKKPMHLAKHLRDRKLQRALLQFFKPENYFEVRRALEQAGRQDLIGRGWDALIDDRPPKEALDHRRRQANVQLRSGGKSAKPSGKPAKSGGGYRPHRNSANRRPRQ